MYKCTLITSSAESGQNYDTAAARSSLQIPLLLPRHLELGNKAYLRTWYTITAVYQGIN